MALVAGVTNLTKIPKAGIIRQSYQQKKTQWEIEEDTPARRRLRSPEFKEDAKLDMVSHYELLSVTQGYALIKFVLDTGKKHQIRLNCCYALKTPIFNDGKYGFERVVDKAMVLPD